MQDERTAFIDGDFFTLAYGDMYQHINLRGDDQGRADDDNIENPPNGMDEDKTFVFVHGYNVSEEAARGWNAEIFKRMYWSGSHATFHGVTWKGNETQIPGTSMTPNYHINVRNAFDAADELAAYINDLKAGGAEVVLAGHSLGNMLCSSAIQDHGAQVDKYFMINAAVALEAYDSSVRNDPNVGLQKMLHCDWREDTNDKDSPPSYNQFLYASDWYTHFPDGDGRKELKWADRFKDVVNVAYNFYTPGEDVVDNFEDCFDAPDDGLGGHAWVKQEKLKGRMPVNMGGSNYGGWGFSPYHNVCEEYEDEDGDTWLDCERIPAVDANQLDPVVLKEHPFFRKRPWILLPSWIDDLYDPTAGSTFAIQEHGKLLGGMIPALTFGAAANELKAVDTPSEIRNFNMNTSGQNGFQTGWPQERDNTDWGHSDLKNIAYPYVYKLFDKFVSEGDLR